MKRTVIQARKFSQILDDLISQGKLTDADFEEFEQSLVKDPQQGDLLQGTGGVRKTRLKSASKGKRGGFRVCYFDDSKIMSCSIDNISEERERESDAA